MNSTEEESDINDISFRHEFDPVTIKCEILDEELQLPIDDTMSETEEKSINIDTIDEQINNDDGDISMSEFQIIKIKNETTLESDNKNETILGYESNDEDEIDNLSMDAVLVKEEIKKETVEENTTSNFGNHFMTNEKSGLKQMETQSQSPGCSTLPKSNVSSGATPSCTMTLTEKKRLKKKSQKSSSTYMTKKRKKNETPEEEYFPCEFCAMPFKLKHHLNYHLNPNPDSGNLNLPCLYCNTNFEDVSDLEKHIKNIHKACKLCDIIFASIKDYYKHIRLHKSGSITFYLCCCGVEFKNEKLFVIHAETVHKNRYNYTQALKREIKETCYEKMVCKKSILCPYCHINFSDENALINHKRMVHNVIKCVSCTYHIYCTKRSETASVDFICEKCKKKKDIKIVSNLDSIENVSELEDSSHSHESTEKIEESLSKNDSLKIPKIKKLKGEIPKAIKYKCKICSLKFTNEKDLKRHLKLPDLNNLNLPCLYCKKTCKNGKKLEKHLKKVHHACKICDVTFSNKKEISLHFNDHKLGLIIFFVCACGDEFKDFVTFHIHVKFNHKNDEQFINPIKNSIIDIEYKYINCADKKICPYCNKSYNCDSDLAIHKNDIHNVYLCQSCNNHFTVNEEEKSTDILQCIKCRNNENKWSSSSDSDTGESN